MTNFTDPLAAIEEAQFLAESNGEPYAVVKHKAIKFTMRVVGLSEVARSSAMEVCWP